MREMTRTLGAVAVAASRVLRQWLVILLATLCSLAGFAMVSLANAQSAGASTFNIACDDVAALKAAIASANASPLSPTTINLAPRCTYLVDSRDNATDGGNGLPVVTGQITLNGSGSTIARSPTATQHFRVLEVGMVGKLSLAGLTVTGGMPDGNGGGISNDGILVLNLTTVNANTAGGGHPLGGGVFNRGTATLNTSEVRNNETAEEGAAAGGGIDNQNTLSLRNSRVISNRAALAGFDTGGGIESSGHLSLDSSVVSDNVVVGLGAGLAAGGGINGVGSFTFNSSSVSSNRAESPGGGVVDGGGINLAALSATLSLSASRVDDNAASVGSSPHSTGLVRGGGITNGGGTVVAHASQVSGNVASGPAQATVVGGGIMNNGASTLAASRVADNSASGGGGIYNGVANPRPSVGSPAQTNLADLTLDASRVVGNHATSEGGDFRGGAGVFDNGHTVSFKSSQIVDNTVTAPAGTPARGGGLLNNAGVATLKTSIVHANRAVGSDAAGGGIFEVGGTVSLLMSLVLGNQPDNCRPPGSVAGCAN